MCISNGGGTSRENPYRVGYRVRELKSGPGRVYPMQIGKPPQYFQAGLREYADWWPTQAIDRAAIFKNLSPQILRTHKNTMKALAHYKDFHNDFPKKIVVKIIAHI